MKSDSDSDSDDDDDEPEWKDSWLVTGGSDGALRQWDVETGRVIQRMSVDKLRVKGHLFGRWES